MPTSGRNSLLQIENAIESAPDNAANGAPAREPEVWDERIDAFNPLFDHTPEPSPVSTAFRWLAEIRPNHLQFPNSMTD